MKLVFTSSDRFPPFRVGLTVLFGKAIPKRGHSVNFLLQSEKKLLKSFVTRWHGCRVWVGFSFKGNSLPDKFLNNMYRMIQDIRLLPIVQEIRPDCIIVRDKFLSAIIPLLIAKLFHIKLVYWLSYPIAEHWLYQAKNAITHFPIVYRLRGYISKLILYKFILQHSDHAFVTTTHMLKYVYKRGIPASKMTVVPMAASPTEITYYGYKDNYWDKDANKLIVYIGTLNRLRKIDFLLRVFSKIKDIESGTKLLLIGGGDYDADVSFIWREAEKLKICQSIMVTGFVSQRKAWEYAKEALVCVSPIFPSPILNFGMPTKIFEYMAMGKAIVGNDQPEQKRILSESNAGICVPYDEDAFACAIIQLLKSPKMAKKFGDNGRRYVIDHGNYDQVAQHVENTLLKVCELGRR